jgi:hypothetical protein
MTDTTYPTAPHTTIDYAVLTDAVTDLKGLGAEVSALSSVHRLNQSSLPSASGTVENNITTLGNGQFRTALASFYAAWAGPMNDASDWISKLETIFQGVADAFMHADAAEAAAINAGTAISAAQEYPYLMDNYLQELTNYYKYDPFTKSQLGQVKGVALPKMPTAPDNPKSMAPGVSTTFDEGVVDANPRSPVYAYSWPRDLPTTETTTVHAGGLTYSETTTFGADKGWGPNGPTQDTNQVITNPDGSTDTVTVNVNLDGTATMQDVNVNGKTTTTWTYSRSGWTAPWVDTTPVTQDGNSVTSGSGPDVAPFVN